MLGRPTACRGLGRRAPSGKITGDVVVFNATKCRIEAVQGQTERRDLAARATAERLTPSTPRRRTTAAAARAVDAGGPGGGDGPRGDFHLRWVRPESAIHEGRGRGGDAHRLGEAARLARHHGRLARHPAWPGPQETDRSCSSSPALRPARRRGREPEGAKTRIELEVDQQVHPRPDHVYNTVGEIRGSEKPDEFVVLGAHLDSWDLARARPTTAPAACVVLEAARILARKSGIRPQADHPLHPVHRRGARPARLAGVCRRSTRTRWPRRRCAWSTTPAPAR